MKKHSEGLMTLIKCDSDCIYQKEGYCTNEDETFVGETLNLALDNGCIYYVKNDEKTNCFAR